ncbi:MAG TPA: GNAT family N-acetyltransferase [Rhodanobacteraceae bacterium]|nr:GNAT family N-acetyltransferase [Rhodanobacteraceae bacterium]
MSALLDHLCQQLRSRQLTVREETGQDQAFTAALYASTRIDELAAVDWPMEQKRAFVRQQFEAQRQGYRANYPGALFGLIERQGQPLGRCYLWQGATELRLMEITLSPEQRGQGLGSAVLAALLGFARAAALDITLHVEPGNPAQRLYARLGFTLEEHRGVYDFLRWRPLS